MQDVLSDCEKKETSVGNIVSWLTGQISERLNVEKEEIDINETFVNLGLQSTDVLILSGKMEAFIRRRLPQSVLWHYDTIQLLAEYIAGEMGEASGPDSNPGKSVGAEAKDILDKKTVVDKSFLYEECRLDESIRPDASKDRVAVRPEKIFLTGSTGFVGAYLIQSIMEHTAADVYCHVRAKNEEEAFARIKGNAEYFKCWRDEYKARIIPVIGDLTKPLLGIKEDAFKYLSEIIDAVYHNGAILNFVYPYRYLKEVNVTATGECLRFACMNKAKAFHYISTFSVFDNPSHFKKVVYENDPLAQAEGYYLGYTESKWVAEKLVRMAEKRGLHVCIYRPGEITGARSTGIWKMGDAISRFIIACIQMGAMPDVSNNIHMTPVDFIADAIVHLSMQKQSCGKAFHLINNNIKNVRELAGIIGSFGYNIEMVPYDEWKQKLVQAGPENPLKLLESLFLEEKSEEESITRRYGDLEAKFDSTNVFNGLKDSGIHCEPMDEGLIFRYLNFFSQSGYIKKPIPM